MKGEEMKIAIPSTFPGGMNASRSEHFGHSDIFTIVELNGTKINTVELVDNISHAQGGCTAPVRLLKNAGVEAVVVTGLGARPMEGLSSAGIQVYFAASSANMIVADVIQKFIDGKLPQIQPTQLCKGSSNCHH